MHSGLVWSVSTKIAASNSLRFRSACEEDLDNLLVEVQFFRLKQSDYSFLISDSWHRLHISKVLRDRIIELII